MHTLVYLDCSFTHCYKLSDEAENCRQFSLMNGLTSRTSGVFTRKSIRNRQSLETLNQF